LAGDFGRFRQTAAFQSFYRHFAFPLSLAFWSVPGASGDEAFYTDGRSSGTGTTFAFLAFRQHPAIAPILEQFNLGYSDVDAEHCLVIDCHESRASVAPIAQAEAFLRNQHPPLPELTPYEREDLQRQFLEILAQRRQQERRIDNAEILRRMDEERCAVARMLAYLDQQGPFDVPTES
jgi:hypothetical protein